MVDIFDGAVVTLHCSGMGAGDFRYLNGLTHADFFGGVFLTKTSDNFGLTGTHWQCSQVGSDTFTFACAGSINGPRYLNGDTVAGAVNLVGDTLDPFSGTTWQVQTLDSGEVYLACQGKIPNVNHLYLDGRTADGSVGMAPNGAPPYTGTVWRPQLVATPSITINTRRQLTASMLDVVGTNFNAFDTILITAEGIHDRQHVPIELSNVHADGLGVFRKTLVVDRWPDQPLTDLVTIRATDQHGISGVGQTNGFAY